MTYRMANALAHIQTAEDVDEWAKKVVEEKFIAFDVLFMLLNEMRENIKEDGDLSSGFKSALELVMGLITEAVK